MNPLDTLRTELEARHLEIDLKRDALSAEVVDKNRHLTLLHAQMDEIGRVLDRLAELDRGSETHSTWNKAGPEAHAIASFTGADAPRPRAPRRDVRAAVLDHLTTRAPATPEEISSALDVPARGIDKALAYWSKKGRIERGGERWGIMGGFPGVQKAPPPLRAPAPAEAPPEPVDEGALADDIDEIERQEAVSANVGVGAVLGAHLSAMRGLLDLMGPQTLTQMQGRGIPPDAVRAAIAQGILTEERERGFTVYALVEAQEAAAE